MRTRMPARVSENERIRESEAAHGRGSYGPASEVASERKSAAEKEQALLTTEGCSKRKTAHARVSMSWCLILVACVLATDINNALMLSSRCSEARAPRGCRCRRSAAARAVRTCLSSTRARGHARLLLPTCAQPTVLVRVVSRRAARIPRHATHHTRDHDTHMTRAHHERARIMRAS